MNVGSSSGGSAKPIYASFILWFMFFCSLLVLYFIMKVVLIQHRNVLLSWLTAQLYHL